MTALEVRKALARRYHRPQYFFLSEASLEGRRFDGLAIGAYATHGWPLLGFEIKVARSDWLQELKDPGKSDRLFRRVDQWFVVSPTGVVSPDEVPGPWGWIEVSKRGCRVRKPAPKREAAPVDRELLLRALFKLEERWVEDVVRREREAHDKANERIELERSLMRQGLLRELGGAAKALDELRAEVKAFEEASGVEVHGGWRSGPQVGAAVKLVLDLRAGAKWTLGEIPKKLRHVADQVESVAAECRALAATPVQDEE